jgi:hypothetical protein
VAVLITPRYYFKVVTSSSTIIEETKNAPPAYSDRSKEDGGKAFDDDDYNSLDCCHDPFGVWAAILDCSCHGESLYGGAKGKRRSDRIDSYNGWPSSTARCCNLSICSNFLNDQKSFSKLAQREFFGG